MNTADKILEMTSDKSVQIEAIIVSNDEYKELQDWIKVEERNRAFHALTINGVHIFTLRNMKPKKYKVYQNGKKAAAFVDMIQSMQRYFDHFDIEVNPHSPRDAFDNWGFFSEH